MPKLLCPCGFVHEQSPIPDDGWRTVRDRDYERLIELERKGQQRYEAGQGVAPASVRDSDALQGLLYECPQCGRLLWRPPRGE